MRQYHNAVKKHSAAFKAQASLEALKLGHGFIPVVTSNEWIGIYIPIHATDADSATGVQCLAAASAHGTLVVESLGACIELLLMVRLVDLPLQVDLGVWRNGRRTRLKICWS